VKYEAEGSPGLSALFNLLPRRTRCWADCRVQPAPSRSCLRL